MVTLMTLHTAKGLEFPTVFLTGLEDGVFPHSRSLTMAASSRRNAGSPTSGVTRARERLYVSRALVRSAWGAPAHNPASRFLGEVPDELVDWRRTEADQVHWQRPDLTVAGRRGLGAPTSAGRRNFTARPPPAPTPPRSPSRPARCRRCRPATGSLHDTFGLGTVVAVEGVARQVRRLDRLRLRGRQAAAAELRAGGEALSDRAERRTQLGLLMVVQRAALPGTRSRPACRDPLTPVPTATTAAARAPRARCRGRPGRRRRGAPRGGGGGR